MADLTGGQQSYEVQLAAKMQLILEQPMSDITTKLTNTDFEGEFFKIGDTVSIVKPNLESVKVEVNDLLDSDAAIAGMYYDEGTSAHKLVGTTENDIADRRLEASDLKFSKTVLQINKTMKYAFIISDITKAEGKWDYESGNLDLAAHEMRKKHNLKTTDLIISDADVQHIEAAGAASSVANPLTLSSVDELYTKVIVPMYTKLYNVGAITADGQVTYGSNAQQSKSTSAGIFLPAECFGMLLQSKYLTDRSTTAADDKVATANIKQILGMDIAIEPSLSPASEFHCDTLTDDTVYAIVAGTRNCVTRASKVLAPDKFRSHERFATEYHGMELFGEKVFEPQSAVVAFVKIA